LLAFEEEEGKEEGGVEMELEEWEGVVEREWERGGVLWVEEEEWLDVEGLREEEEKWAWW